MKTFYINVYEEMSGTVEIQANTEVEAKQKAQEMLDTTGIVQEVFNCKHRDTQVL